MNRYPYDEKALEKEYPLAARCARPEGSIVAVGDVKIGPGTLTLIAGPCAVESREQLFTTAAAVKAAGAAILRGGTYKPRTSPYAFAGLGEEGLRLLAEAGREFHIPVVSEITSAELLPLFDGIDMLQVGARNMQNGWPRRSTFCGRGTPTWSCAKGASAATKAAPAARWTWRRCR